MADKVVAFGASDGFGALVGWELQGSGSGVISDRAAVLDDTGNEADSILFNERTEGSSTYQSNLSGSAPTIPASIGALVNGLVLTSISLSTTQNGHVTMTLTGHNHTENAHAAEPALASVAHGVTLDDGFGVTDFFGGTAGDNAAPISSNLTISCEHADVQDEVGDHFVGENYNPRMSGSVQWAGVPTSTDDASWDVTTKTTDTGNVNFITTTVNGEKALTFA